MIEDWKILKIAKGYRDVYIKHLTCPRAGSDIEYVALSLSGGPVCVACLQEPPKEIIDAAILCHAYPFD